MINDIEAAKAAAAEIVELYRSQWLRQELIPDGVIAAIIQRHIPSSINERLLAAAENLLNCNDYKKRIELVAIIRECRVALEV